MSEQKAPAIDWRRVSDLMDQAEAADKEAKAAYEPARSNGRADDWRKFDNAYERARALWHEAHERMRFDPPSDEFPPDSD